MNELFIISPKSIKAYDRESVVETIKGLKAMDLFHLPYPKVDIQLPLRLTKNYTIPKGTDVRVLDEIFQGHAVITEPSPEPTPIAIRYIGVTEDGRCERAVFEAYAPELDPKVIDSGYYANQLTCDNAMAYLIVLLATRNTVKEQRVNKLLKLGIGKNKRKKDSEASYPRVTTITIPEKLEPDKDNPPTGRTVCAHLRRGHIRHQRYGPDNAYAKAIWIEPVFVNADESFVSKRRAYNLKL